MQNLSNVSKKNSWQKIIQQVKHFFQSDPNHSIKGEEIDYYHQYVFPKKIERMEQARNTPSLSKRNSRRKL